MGKDCRRGTRRRGGAILWCMAQDLETINRWTGSAPYWEKHREVIRQMFVGITEGLVADARVARGQMVLDVATGPGERALSVAGWVGRGGKICAIDMFV